MLQWGGRQIFEIDVITYRIVIAGRDVQVNEKQPNVFAPKQPLVVFEILLTPRLSGVINVPILLIRFDLLHIVGVLFDVSPRQHMNETVKVSSFRISEYCLRP